MSDTDFSRSTADLFSQKHDQNMELRKYRTFIPEDVLKTFCGAGEPSMWFVYEENQMYAAVREDFYFPYFFYNVSSAFATTHFCDEVTSICMLGTKTDDIGCLLPGT